MTTISDANASSGERRFPRIPWETPVEIRTDALTTIGKTDNACLGGLLIKCPETFQRGREIEVLFNLPTGHSIKARCTVAHVQPDYGFGVSFLDLTEEHLRFLGDFLSQLSTYVRRSDRISKRLAVTLRRDQAPEEMAETMVISQHGGLLVTRARFQVNDRLTLRWPEQKRLANIRIVFSRPSGSGGLQELGFEFMDEGNLWGIAWLEDQAN